MEIGPSPLHLTRIDLTGFFHLQHVALEEGLD